MQFRPFRNAFFTGLFLLLPLAATIFVINFLIKNIGAPSSRLFFWYLDSSLRNKPWLDPFLDLLSIVFVAVIIMVVGWLSRYFFGRWLVHTAERVVAKLPFINTVYKTVKQVVDTFGEQNKSVFQKVVLIQYPRPGCYALGFLTSVSEGEVQFKTGQTVANVFVPTTPNPTSGFLLMVPKEEIIDLDMTVGDGMKLVISGGAVVPPYKAKEIKEV